MVQNEGEPRLGIEEFPAEGGLFVSVLESSGLYAQEDKGWRFVSPMETLDDPCFLAPMWEAALAHF